MKAPYCRRTLLVALGAVCVSAQIAASAIPGGMVTDAEGDALGGGPDIAWFATCYTDTELELDVSLFTPWSDQTALFVELDVDRNPKTGVPGVGSQGVDFMVSTVGHQSRAVVLNLVTNQGITAPLTLGSASVSIRVPLAAIGGGDGIVDADALVGAPNGTAVVPISDKAPDAGQLTSTACAGFVPTTTIAPTTTSTTIADSTCTSDPECDDGNPCAEHRCTGGQCVSHPVGGAAGADCELTQAGGAICSPKLQRTMKRKLAKARTAIDRAAAAASAKKKEKAKSVASAAVRAIAKKAAHLAADGRLSDACARQIDDATQRMLRAIMGI